MKLLLLIIAFATAVLAADKPSAPCTLTFKLAPMTNGVTFNIRYCPSTNFGQNWTGYCIVTNIATNYLRFAVSPSGWTGVFCTNRFTGHEYADGGVCPVGLDFSK